MPSPTPPITSSGTVWVRGGMPRPKYVNCILASFFGLLPVHFLITSSFYIHTSLYHSVPYEKNVMDSRPVITYGTHVHQDGMEGRD